MTFCVQRKAERPRRHIHDAVPTAVIEVAAFGQRQEADDRERRLIGHQLEYDAASSGLNADPGPNTIAVRIQIAARDIAIILGRATRIDWPHGTPCTRSELMLAIKHPYGLWKS